MQRSIFLCTPLHDTTCPFYSSLLSTCTAHLLSSHPELSALHQSHGLTALEALVRRGHLTPSTPGAPAIFICDFPSCRHYALTPESAITHCTAVHAAHTAVVRAEFGSVGVARMVEERMHGVVMHDADPAEVEEPGMLVIAGAGVPMLAETVAQLADMIRRGAGPRVGGWSRAMRDGTVRVHFDHREGSSGICSVRTDERVALLKRVMEFGVVKVGEDEEDEGI